MERAQVYPVPQGKEAREEDAEPGAAQAFMFYSQSSAGPQTFLPHEASEHLVVAACQGFAGD